MANFKKVDVDERARLARAYLRGNTPPYQAARNVGFRTVGEMQEAIRAMETREREAQESQEAIAFPVEAPAAGCKRFGPEGTECVKNEPAPAEPVRQVVYPFLPPGTIAADPKKRPLYALHTRDVTVKRLEGASGAACVQLTLTENRHSLDIPVGMLDKVSHMLALAIDMERSET